MLQLHPMYLLFCPTEIKAIVYAICLRSVSPHNICQECNKQLQNAIHFLFVGMYQAKRTSLAKNESRAMKKAQQIRRRLRVCVSHAACTLCAIYK